MCVFVRISVAIELNSVNTSLRIYQYGNRVYILVFFSARIRNGNNNKHYGGCDEHNRWARSVEVPTGRPKQLYGSGQ